MVWQCVYLFFEAGKTPAIFGKQADIIMQVGIGFLPGKVLPSAVELGMITLLG